MGSIDPLLLRFIERLVAVLLGGMAIYFGYRLFRDVPQMTDSSGKVVLPWNISVAVTRVGPGVFFALFGVAAVAVTLVMPLRMSDGARREAGSAPARDVVYAADPLGGDTATRSDARRLLAKEMNLLNTIPRQLRADLSPQDREDVEDGLARVKLLLLRPVWGTPDEGFADFVQFQEWVRAGAPGPPPPGMRGAVDLFRKGLPG